jgi:hypothetical protein
MRWFCPLVMLTVLVAAGLGRPKMPEVTTTVLFNTPEADRILAAVQVFPSDNPWNEDLGRQRSLMRYKSGPSA